jgi:TonB family protein
MRDPLIHAVGLTLLHFLWQGLLIGMAARAGLSSTTCATARQRHAVCVGALVACVLAPILTVLVLIGSATGTGPRANATVLLGAGSGRGIILNVGSAHEHALGGIDLMSITVGLWLAGALVIATNYVLQWIAVDRVRRSALPLQFPPAFAELARQAARRWEQTLHVPVLVTTLIITPVVIGLWRPVILFPAATLAHMSPDDFELILLHELAHVVRRDAWVNALSLGLKVVLFYHPVVHWLARRTQLERECACDELVVQTSGYAYRYAKALTALACARSEPMILSLGAASGDLLARLRNLAGDRSPEEPLPGNWSHPLLLLVLLGCLVCMQPSWFSHGRAAKGANPRPLSLPNPEPTVQSSVQPARSERALPAAPVPDHIHFSTRLASSSHVSPWQDEQRRSRLAMPSPRSARELSPLPAPELSLDAPVAPDTPAGGDVPAAPEELPPPTSPTVDPATPSTAAAAAPDHLTALFAPPPDYPAQARLAGIEGTVDAALTIATDGHVTRLQIVKATPLGVFEGAVRHALMRWRFSGFSAGAAGEITTIQHVRFSLTGVSLGEDPLCSTATVSRACRQP